MSDVATPMATALASRMCHDLTSPLGAIQNGLELLALSSSQEMGPEMELVQHSAQAAVAKIRFFRLAFGSASSVGTISAAELAAVMAPPGGPARITVTPLPDRAYSRAEAQKLCLALLCLATLSPTGGRVDVAEGPGGMSLCLTAPRPLDDTVLSQRLDEATATSSEPSKIHVQLLETLLGQSLRQVVSHTGGPDLRLTLTHVSL